MDEIIVQQRNVIQKFSFHSNKDGSDIRLVIEPSLCSIVCMGNMGIFIMEHK